MSSNESCELRNETPKEGPKAIKLGKRVGLEVFGLVPSADNHLTHLKRLASRTKKMQISLPARRLFEELGVAPPPRTFLEGTVVLFCDLEGQAYMRLNYLPTFTFIETFTSLGDLTPRPLAEGDVPSVRARLRTKMVRFFGAAMECDTPILESLYFGFG